MISGKQGCCYGNEKRKEQWKRVMVLLAECCDKDPDKRPTMSQVRQKWEESDFERDVATDER